MAEQNKQSKYTHGYSNYTTATHEQRTAEVDGAFLLPHIKKTDVILDVGCGPGTITTGFAKYASEGRVVGVDISTAVLAKAKAIASEAKVPTSGPGSVTFEEGNILTGLAYPDNTFDVVFASQVFGHLPPPDLPLKALIEIRRVLKPGGVVATRDAGFQHFFPKSSNLDRLWVENQQKVVRKGSSADLDGTGPSMPALMRRAGFDADGGKVRIGAGSTVFSGAETRRWLAWRVAGQLKKGDQFYQGWLDAGISEDEIAETVAAVQKWAETEDAWFASLQCEMLAWK